MTVLNIAHRGASSKELENSLAAFRLASDLGCDMVELDARSTLDGKVIVMHDETINRTTNGAGKIAGMEFDELMRFKLRNAEPIPTLEDVLKALKGRCQVNVELKDYGSVQTSGALVREMGMQSDVLFSCFNGPWLLTLKNRFHWARVGFACRDKDIEAVHIGQSLKAEAIHTATKLTNAKFVEQAHESGLKVNVWTVNRERQMLKFADMGVDGIITNKPDLLVKVLGSN